MKKGQVVIYTGCIEEYYGERFIVGRKIYDPLIKSYLFELKEEGGTGMILSSGDFCYTVRR